MRELEEEIAQLKQEPILNKKLSGSLTGFDNLKENINNSASTTTRSTLLEINK
jgi:hypothetical protein